MFEQYYRKIKPLQEHHWNMLSLTGNDIPDVLQLRQNLRQMQCLELRGIENAEIQIAHPALLGPTLALNTSAKRR